MGYAFLMGQRTGKKFEPNLYNYGAFEDNWVDGYAEIIGTTTRTKETDHMKTICSADAAFVTSQAVDLTNIASVKFTYQIGYQKGSVETMNPLTTITLNVSALSGSYYIRFHSSRWTQGSTRNSFIASTNQSGSISVFDVYALDGLPPINSDYSIIKVYKVWLE